MPRWCMSSLEVGAEVDVQDNTYQLSSDSYAIWACGDVDENANCARLCASECAVMYSN